MTLFRKKSAADTPRRRQAGGVSDGRPTEADLERRYSFRRNQTLTGSSSSSVVSPSEAGARLKSPRVEAHGLVRFRRKLLLTLFVVIAAIVLLYGLITQFTARAVVHTADLSVQLDERYENTIQDYFDEHPLERLRFALNADNLSKYVMTALPEVDSIIPGGSAGLGQSDFTVTMRRPVAGWNVSGEQEYVDARGVSFTRNYFDEPSVQIVYDSAVRLSPGQRVVGDSFLGFVGRVVGIARGQGYTVNKVVIQATATRQIEVLFKGIEYPVRFSVDRSAGEQIEDMTRAVEWMKAHHQEPKYLDVRVSGRAFYK